MRGTDASNRDTLAKTLGYWLTAFVATLLVLLLVLLSVRSFTGQLTLRVSALEAGIATVGLLAAVFGLRALIASIFGRFNLRLWLPLPIVALTAITLGRHTADANATAVVWLVATVGELFSIAWWRRPESSPEPVIGNEQANSETVSSDSMPTTSVAVAVAATSEALHEIETESDSSGRIVSQSGVHQSAFDNGAAAPQGGTSVALEDGASVSSTADSGSGQAGEEIGDELVTQAITRLRDPDGSETITGHVRVDFEPHEKHGSAHISFTPPLRWVPEVSLEQSSGPTASISPGAVYAHGARFDLRLHEVSAEPASVRFEIYVQAPSEMRELDGNEVLEGESDV